MKPTKCSETDKNGLYLERKNKNNCAYCATPISKHKMRYDLLQKYEPQKMHRNKADHRLVEFFVLECVNTTDKTHFYPRAQLFFPQFIHLSLHFFTSSNKHSANRFSHFHVPLFKNPPPMKAQKISANGKENGKSLVEKRT